MKIAKFMAAQLRKPSGFFGRHVLLHLLNRGNRSMNSQTFDALRLESADRVLEIGFGGGDLIRRMSHIINRGRITGVDFSQDVVEAGTIRFSHLIKAGILDLHCADLEHLPFESGTFTKACTVNTIYFWQNPDAAAAELHRVLKKDGMVLVCFTPKSVMEKLGRVIHHGFTLYEPEQVATLLAAAGFRSVQLFQDKHSSGECMIAAGKK